MCFSTEISKINPQLIKNNQIELLKKEPGIKKGASLLKEGEVAAFPTETVYGLGADAGSKSAVEKIFKAKGRPQDNPLIVHIGTKSQLEDIIKGPLPQAAEKLTDKFWPGPLTLILPKNKRISDKTTAGLNTVGVRMPSHPAARALIQLAALPVAAPSANSSGYPSPTSAQHVYNDLKGKIPLIIDGGTCAVGVESTVVKLKQGHPTVLRPGGITREEISSVLEQEIEIQTESGKDDIPVSPGMKYRHYSPTTLVKLIKTQDLSRIKELLAEYDTAQTALVLTTESKNKFSDLSFLHIEDMGRSNKLEEIAHSIFAILRKLDRLDFNLILVETIAETGLGEAVMNRLHKAASGYLVSENKNQK